MIYNVNLVHWNEFDYVHTRPGLDHLTSTLASSQLITNPKTSVRGNQINHKLVISKIELQEQFLHSEIG